MRDFKYHLIYIDVAQFVNIKKAEISSKRSHKTARCQINFFKEPATSVVAVGLADYPQKLISSSLHDFSEKPLLDPIGDFPENPLVSPFPR